MASTKTEQALYILLISSVEQTRYALKDWVHREYLYSSEENARNALTRFVVNTELTNDIIDMIDITLPVEIERAYLLFHFCDNYCDNYMSFLSRDVALDKFYECCKIQDGSLIDDGVMRLVYKDEGNSNDPSMIGKQYAEKLMSTLYEFDIFDKLNRLVYCEKGDRWVLMELDVSSLIK
jgi:hypothetical protein